MSAGWTGFGKFLGLVTDIAGPILRAMRLKNAKDKTDRIYVDPGSAWLFKFKRGQADASGAPSASKPGDADRNG